MKYSAAFMAFAAAIFAKEIPKDPKRAAELYDSGVMHEMIMSAKAEQLHIESEMGVLNSLAGPDYQELHFAQCKDGKAVPFRDRPDFFFRCNNVCYHTISTTYHCVLTNFPRLTCTTSSHILILGPPRVWDRVPGDGSVMMDVSSPSLRKLMALRLQRCSVMIPHQDLN
jgi:hypothetical protein